MNSWQKVIKNLNLNKRHFQLGHVIKQLGVAKVQDFDFLSTLNICQ